MTLFGISKKMDCMFDSAVLKAREGLEKEGFGILSEINIADTIRQELNLNFRNYLIVGACNNGLAHKALTIEPEIGLLLPYNLVIYENDEGGCTVAAIDPEIAMSMIENPALALLAKEARERLERMIKAL